MNECPLCGLEIDDSDLTRHYLKDQRLTRSIQKSYPNWTPEQGACSRCLEMHYRDSIPGVPEDEEVSEERTVVTAAEGLIGQDGQDGSGQICLIVIHGSELGKKFELREGDMTIGRAENASIRINEENVSRQHARIYRQGNEAIIEDLRSTNGTFVNTKKVTRKVLSEGDLVLIGNTILKFVSGWTVENRYHEEIYRLATLDGLTQAYNKSFLLDRMTLEFGRSKRYDRQLSLILYDFDHFKDINDTHGHLAGDEILRTSSSMIMQSMRKEDVLGRYGGEEFAILLPETSMEDTVPLAEKIRKLIETTPFHHDDKVINATISVGVATLKPNMDSVNQFLENADRALYRAKKSGRNCVRS